MKTIALLFSSNTFMTFAWYWHLKSLTLSLWKVVLISWGLALIEYCFAVPANRLGFQNGLDGFQLKILQEVITVLVFSVFAVLYLREPLQWKYAISFLCIIGAVYFAFK